MPHYAHPIYRKNHHARTSNVDVQDLLVHERWCLIFPKTLADALSLECILRAATAAAEERRKFSPRAANGECVRDCARLYREWVRCIHARVVARVRDSLRRWSLYGEVATPLGLLKLRGLFTRCVAKPLWLLSASWLLRAAVVCKRSCARFWK